MNTQARAALTEHLRMLRDGHKDAVQPAFNILWPRLTALARRCGLSHSDSEDAAQQAIIKAIRRVEDYNPTRDGMSWVLAMTAYEARTLRRQRWRRRETSMDNTLDSFSAAGDEHDPLVSQEVWRDIEGAMSALSANDRAALWAAFDRPRSSEALGAALRKRKQRAMERLLVKVHASMPQK
jgi:RNA polymerase sigma factor (sigma-70 family)